MAQKYYAVRKGHAPGIYGCYDEAAKQIKGYSSPDMRVFKTYAKAQEYMSAPAAAKTPKAQPVRPARYYAVRKGHMTGIFLSVKQYDAAVKGYSNPEARVFDSLAGAKEYMRVTDRNEYASTLTRRPDLEGLKAATAYVDGSYEPTAGRCGYGAVLLCDGLEVHIRGLVHDKYGKRNITGEIYAAVAAMMYCAAHGIRKLYLYHDFDGIRTWLDIVEPYGLALEYRDFVSRLKHVVDVEFIKVKAHAGIPLNERADELAREARGYDCWQYKDIKEK